MALIGIDTVWCGCEDGKVVAYDVITEQLQGSYKVQAGAVSAIAVVGLQVSEGAAAVAVHVLC